jgi:hypothetical protein
MSSFTSSDAVGCHVSNLDISRLMGCSICVLFQFQGSHYSKTLITCYKPYLLNCQQISFFLVFTSETNVKISLKARIILKLL